MIYKCEYCDSEFESEDKARTCEKECALLEKLGEECYFCKNREKIEDNTYYCKTKHNMKYAQNHDCEGYIDVGEK